LFACQSQKQRKFFMQDFEQDQSFSIADTPDEVQNISHMEKVRAVVTNGVSYIEEAMPRFIEDLQTLCLIDSPSDNKAGLDVMAQQLADMLHHVGVQTRIVEHARGNAIVGTLEGDTPTAPAILLIGHHDTVHPVGSAQARTQLAGEKFYAPGTVDMKAGLLQGIYALEILQHQGYKDFNKIIFLSVPDEEISQRYHVGLIKELARKRPHVIGLEGASAVGTVVIRRKGCMHYRLTAEGQAAHAGSSPKRGRNAVLELAHQIVQANSFAGWREGFTINAGPIHGGSRANVVSDFAEILFDTRFLQPDDRIATEERWQELLQQQLVPGVKLTLQAEPDSMVPMVTNAESLTMAHYVQMIAEDILHKPYEPESRGGASDCCNTAAAGCPTIDGLGAIGGGAHTSHEFASLSPVPDRTALLAGLIVAISKRHTHSV
jgi:glutamate carboxypeptidase